MADLTRWLGAVIGNRHSMEPIRTNVDSRLERLQSIRAVIFDVYGTLLISGSGDVGAADRSDRSDAIVSALKASGCVLPADQIPQPDELHTQIETLNDQRRSDNCPTPEVDIVAAWRRVLHHRHVDFRDHATWNTIELAAEYESTVNPTWPMPGARRLLSDLKSAEIPLGVVSNAQIFTLPLLEDLLAERDLARGGFDLDLCMFSNRFRHSKPGPRLFEALATGLSRRGLRPDQALYVGNDMLNDIWAASQVGLKTAWFAGDARSCRRRADDSRCESLRPNLVLTELMQLSECLQLG